MTRKGVWFGLLILFVLVGCASSAVKSSTGGGSPIETSLKAAKVAIDAKDASALLPLLAEDERNNYQLTVGKLQKILDIYGRETGGYDEGPIVVSGDLKNGSGVALFSKNGIKVSHLMITASDEAPYKGASVIDGLFMASALARGHKNNLALDSRKETLTAIEDGAKALRSDFEAAGLDRLCNGPASHKCNSWDEEIAQIDKALVYEEKKAQGK